MFKHRSLQKEWLEQGVATPAEIHKNFDEMEKLNRYFGGKKAMLKALNQIYHQYPVFKVQETIIGDLGCGHGDLLRCIKRWALRKKVTVKLVGIDSNAVAIQYALEKTAQTGNIQFFTLDIFSQAFKNFQFDIIFLNNICHHFSDEELINVLCLLKRQAKFIVINDLRRNGWSYRFAKLFTTLFNYSALSKHDGPLSVLRALRKSEWKQIFKKSGVNFYALHKAWAFRCLAIIFCEGFKK